VVLILGDQLVHWLLVEDFALLGVFLFLNVPFQGVLSLFVLWQVFLVAVVILFLFVHVQVVLFLHCPCFHCPWL